jgi:hypothetical protein
MKKINSNILDAAVSLLLCSAAFAGDGVSVNTSGTGYAIKGTNTMNSGSPAGVLGIASDTGSATSTGVQGISNSSSGIGTSGKSPWTGVFGYATALSGETWGVYGKSDSAIGTGVFGTGKSYGVFGQALDLVGWDLYSQGNAKVVGDLVVTGNVSGTVAADAVSWNAVTSYVSLPATAFQPQNNVTQYSHVGHTLRPEGDGWPQVFVAPVQLPHGAQIQKFTLYWSDDSIVHNVSADLYRTNLSTAESIIASVDSSGSSATTGSTTTSTISLPIVDNSLYSYYVWAKLHKDSGMPTIGTLHGVVIEYTIDRPY